SPVMRPSRPNGVLNQGTPAYGYDPYRVVDTSIRRSAAERRTHWLKRSLDVSTIAYSARVRSIAASAADSATSNAFVGTGRCCRSQRIAHESTTGEWGA